MPISAFAAAAQEFRAPVSAPLGQPAPVDYEAMLGLKESAADSTGEMAADNPAESSPPDAALEDPATDPAPPTEPETEGPEKDAESSAPEKEPEDGKESGTTDPAVSTGETSSTDPADPDTSGDAPAGSGSPAGPDQPEDSDQPIDANQPEDAGEPAAEDATAALRQPILREKFDPAGAQYGEPVEMSEYVRIYTRRSHARNAEPRQEYTAIISSIPNTYTDENGQEQPIDNTLVITGEDGIPAYENAANDLQLELPAAFAPGDGLTVTLGDASLRLVPLAGDFTHPAALENAVRYNDVFPGIDVQYTAQEWMVKEDIILTAPTGHTSFSYSLETDLVPRFADGVLALFSPGAASEVDLPVFHFAAPFMEDAAGEASGEVALTYTETGDGQRIVTVSANEDWLNAPERAYPVRIDPSVINTKKAASGLLSPAMSYYERTVGTAVAGFAYKMWAGYPEDDTTFQIMRTIFSFPDLFKDLPAAKDIEIESAQLVLYEYIDLSGGKSTFELFQLKEPCTLEDIKAHQDTIGHWNFIKGVGREYVTQFQSGIGYHYLDVTDAVSDWLTGAAPNYGLMLIVTPEVYNSSDSLGALFYNNYSNLSPNVPPYLEIKWYEVGDVSRKYPLDDTTVNLRPISASDRTGQLDFYGAFWDGIATPASVLSYSLNDTSRGYSGSTALDDKYLYPNSTSFEWLFPSGANKYRRKLSNWQTFVPFTNFAYDTIYTLSATAAKNGTTGKTVTSDSFLVYKVKTFDTLPKVAEHYGVDLDTLMRDNRVVDRMLVENNTLFIRNPKTAAPYTPGDLTDLDKALIDSMLMGRGLHCEFGFEPVNLNTGNFYLNTEDAAVTDYGGQFAIGRTYNSRGADLDSMFGRGWAFDFDEAVSQRADGSFAYKRGDGSILCFTPDGKGGFTGPAGYDLAFSRVKTGEVTKDFGTADDPDPVTFDLYAYTVTGADGTVRRFNEKGLLTSITDADGFVTSLSYGSRQDLTGITTPSGKRFTVTTEKGHITAIGLPNGNTLRYAYNTAGELTAYIDANGNTTRYTYDGAHRMLRWVDANGTAMVTNTYDEKGRVVKQLDGNGNTSTLAYTDGQTTTTDANGNVTVYYYDAQYRTTRIEYPDGTEESFEYNAANRRTAFTDKLGHRTAYEYDAAGNLTTQTRFDGASVQYAYNADNKIVSSTDWLGAETRYEYNANGDLNTIFYADGTRNTFTYNSRHEPVTMTDALGNTVRFFYDGANLVQMTDAAGGVYTFGYDALGRCVSTTDPLGNVAKTVYDAAGRVVGTQDAAGAYTAYEYDAAGRVTASTDANGNRLAYTWDANDNLLSVTDKDGNTWAYTYDALGNKLTETDPVGNVLRFAYDRMGRMTSGTDADGYTTRYEYDALGSIVRITAPDGGETLAEYDYATGGIAQTTDPLGNVTAYEYNAAGLPTRQTNPDGGSITLEYDAMCRLAKYTDLLGLVTEFSYDANGNELSVTDSAGRAVTYERDAMGRAVKTTLPGGGEITYTYDALGRVSQMTDALGGKSALSYNAAGNPVSVTNANGASIGYGYDALGNVTLQTDPKGSEWTTYYDHLSNVILTKDPTGAQTMYVYDAAGRLAEIHDALGNVTSYRLNGRGLPVEITDALGQKYALAYDAAGRLTEETLPDGSSTKYVYNKAGQLIRITDADGLVTCLGYDVNGNVASETNNAGVSNRFTYNAAGLPLTATDALGQTTRYTYDAAGNLIRTVESDGNITAYAYDADGNVTAITDAEGKTTHYTYDANGNLLSSEDASLRQWQYTYDKIGQLTGVTDPLGNLTQYFYDENENLITQQNADGSSLQFGYDALNRATTYTDGNGNTFTNTYDALGQITGQTAADGGELQYAYDALGRVTKQRDPLGYITEYAYDTVGNLVAATLPSGETYSYTYNSTGFRTSETDPLGNVTSWTPDLMNRLTEKTLANGAQYGYTYDVLGRITKLTGPEGQSLAYAYTEAGDLASETDALGRVTSYAYDKMHRLVSVTDAALGVTSLSYDANGNIAEIVSPGGRTQRYTYDALDRVTQALDPAGAVTQYVYDAVGNLTQITEADSRTTTLSYDANGNITGITDALGQTVSFTYDSMDRILSATDAEGARVSYAYDLAGRLVSTTDAMGGLTQYLYDANGNVTAITDAENRETQYAYDALDRLVGVTDGTGANTAYAYDAVGNLVSRTNGNGNTTSYTYDLAGQLTGTTNAKGETTRNTYNAAGNVISTTLPSGKSVSYDYDALDRLVEKSCGEDEAGTTYAYSADGDLVSMRDATGESTFTYDANGRLVSYTNAFDATVGYAYTQNGEIAAITYPDGNAVCYEYDALGRMAKVTDRAGGETLYEYDAQDNVTRVTRADGSVTTAEYDPAGRVQTLTNCDGTGAEVSTFSYTYDATGNIVTETVSMEGETAERSYAYTQRGELASVTENGKTTAYTYDAAGNRIEETTAEGTTRYTYDAADRLQGTTGARVSSYTWDADGNMTGMESEDGVYEYLYDTESRLLAVREGGSLLMSVLYDGLDERVCVLRPADWQAIHTSERQERKWAQTDEDAADDMPGQDSAHETAPNAAETPNEETVPADAQGTGTSRHPFWYGFGQGMLNGFAIFNLPATVDLHQWFHEWWMENWQQPGTGSAETPDGTDGTQEEGMPSAGAQQNGAQGTGDAEAAFTEEDPVRGIQRLITQSFAEQETYTLTGYDVVYYVNDLNRANSEVLTTSTQEAEKAAQSPQADTDDENYIYGIQRLYAEHEETTETYLYDGRGSVVQLLQGGTVSQSYSYNAYGYINADEYGIQAPFYGYNGEQHDPATGLQYLRARYYAPQNGSFTTQDSFAGLLTDALSQNSYTYAQNNPVNYIDPTGHVAKAVQPAAKTGAVKSTAPAVTKTTQSNQAKKTYTTASPASYQKTTYSSGAAKAAQSARLGSDAAASTAARTSVAVNPYVQVTKAGGQTQLSPVPVTKSLADIKKFTRQTCNPSANAISLQPVREPIMLLSAGTISLDPDILTALLDWIAGIVAEKGGTAAVAGTLAVSDGLLPYGDAIAAVLLSTDFLVDAFSQITIEKKGNDNKVYPTNKWMDILANQSTPANPPPNHNDDDDSDDDHEDIPKIIRGKSSAPDEGEPGTIYEQLDDFGHVRSRTLYGSNGKPAIRDDFSGTPHFIPEVNERVLPHRHRYHYNLSNQRDGQIVELIPNVEYSVFPK